MDAIEQLSAKIDALLEEKKKLQQDNDSLRQELESERRKRSQVLDRVNDLLQKIDTEISS